MYNQRLHVGSIENCGHLHMSRHCAGVTIAFQKSAGFLGNGVKQHARK